MSLALVYTSMIQERPACVDSRLSKKKSLVDESKIRKEFVGFPVWHFFFWTVTTTSMNPFQIQKLLYKKNGTPPQIDIVFVVCPAAVHWNLARVASPNADWHLSFLFHLFFLSFWFHILILKGG